MRILMLLGVTSLLIGQVPEVQEIKPHISKPIPVTVTYDLTLQEAWERGDCTPDHQPQTDCFPYNRHVTRQIDVILVSFDRIRDNDEVKNQLKKLGLDPLHNEELISLGATHPQIQKKFWVVSLRPTWGDQPRCPALRPDNPLGSIEMVYDNILNRKSCDPRGVLCQSGFNFYAGKWEPGTRFAAVLHH